MKSDVLERKYYYSKPGWRNGTKEFHDLVTGFIVPEKSTVLEIGPGPENKTSAFLASRAARLDGLDIDERARTNPSLNSALIYDGGLFPLEGESYDVVVADYVMEHVEDPQLMLDEISRVMRPGGFFVFRTPNIYHYVSLVSRFTPYTFHRLTANRARQREVDAVDPYPTFYRFNSLRTVCAIAERSALREIEMLMVEKQPSYLKFNPWAFCCGVLYERFVNSTQMLAGLRSNIFGVLEKEA